MSFELTRVSQALAHWIEALNSRGDDAITQRALTDDVALTRHSGLQKGVTERFEGVDAAARWLRRSPPDTLFSVVGTPEILSAPGRMPIEAEARYRVQVGEFVNQGTWRVTLAEDGRIAALEHMPDFLAT